MPQLTGKLGTWELPHVHMWRDRGTEIRLERRPLIAPDTRIATIGSCFAAELASSMARFGLRGSMHPTGLFYTTRSIRQEIDRIFGGWPEYDREPVWKTSRGYLHPFKDYHRAFATPGELESWSTDLDNKGRDLFRNADVIVMTLGLIESWFNPATGNHFRQIPPPEVFADLAPSFTRLTTTGMRDDLERILDAIRRHSAAHVILTVSPIPLHATVTSHDVRIANTESKHRIRATVSEFVEAHADVHYFHSYEIVATAERQSDFMLEDGRHVARHGVDYIVRQFLATFASEGIDVPAADVSWMTQTTKTAASIHAPNPRWRQLLRAFNR